jgi:hypothetical protein
MLWTRCTGAWHRAEPTAPYSSQSNGVAERLNRTLQGACALCSSTLAAQWRRAGPITTELNGEARHPCEPPTSHGRLAQRVEPRRISRHAVAALLS